MGLVVNETLKPLRLAAHAITADVSAENARGHAFGGIAQASSQDSIAGTFIEFT